VRFVPRSFIGAIAAALWSQRTPATLRRNVDDDPILWIMSLGSPGLVSRQTR
jgi:hypothetical protein